MNNQHNEMINYWRGISIFIVMIFHFTDRLPLEYYSKDISHSVLNQQVGKLGVLIFFIISGYLISVTLETSASISIYLAKRISRIFPLFVVANIFTFCFLMVFPAKPYFAENNGFYTEPRGVFDLIGSIFLLGDFGFNWVDGVYWSILVEMKFYIYISIFIVLFRHSFRERFCQFATILGVLELTILLIGRRNGDIVSIMVSKDWRTVSAALHGIFISQYIPVFAIGVYLSGVKEYRYIVPNIMIAICVAIIVVSDDEFVVIDGIRFILIFAVGIIFDFLVLRGYVGNYIGFYSYSIYLFHQMFGIQVLRWLAGPCGMDVAVIVAVATTLAIAHFASWLFEWRYRRVVTRALVSVFDKFGLGRLKPSIATHQ